jgi:cell division protein FtsN
MADHHQHNHESDRPLRQVFLLLFTAAVCFALGVVIGRSSAPVQQIVKVALPETGDQSAEVQKLNFYNALPKGETTALGNGINHLSPPPATPVPEPPPTTVFVSAAETAPAPLPREIFAEEPAAPAKFEEDKNQENWILQVSSYPREDDAQKLHKKLRSRGYKTAVKPVVIKGKTWFRVFVGPYNSAAAAKEAASKLSRQEKLTPIARKI